MHRSQETCLNSQQFQQAEWMLVGRLSGIGRYIWCVHRRYTRAPHTLVDESGIHQVWCGSICHEHWAGSAQDGCVQVSRAMQRSLALQRLLLITVLGATCMLIGDGTLTPAISVVSSITGLQQNTNIGQREHNLTALLHATHSPAIGLHHCATGLSHLLFSSVQDVLQKEAAGCRTDLSWPLQPASSEFPAPS